MVKSATTIAERLKELATSRHDVKVSECYLKISRLYNYFNIVFH